MNTTGKHKAPLTQASIAADLHDGFMEGFGYWSRNGKYRADDAVDLTKGYRK